MIKLLYFDGLSWDEIVRSADCSLSTLQRFISYIHEERFAGCLQHVKSRTPETDAFLYILSGSNELWTAGADNYFCFDNSAAINHVDVNPSVSDKGRNLLRLAFHLANGIERHNLLDELWYYCSSLEYVELELAIEAIKLVLYPM